MFTTQPPLPSNSSKCTCCIAGSGVSDEELKTIGSKALDTLECRDLKKQLELILTYYRKDARFVDNIMDVTVRLCLGNFRIRLTCI